MPDAVFERRMARHLEQLGQELEQLASAPRANFHFGERERKMHELASAMRALSRILFHDSIANNEETQAQG